MMKSYLRNIFLVSALLLCGWITMAKAEQPDYRKTNICHKAIGKIKIDGEFNETDWKEAPWVGPFWNVRKDEPAADQAKVKFLWDDKNLYIAGKLLDPDICALARGHDGKTLEGDVFEVFIRPDPGKVSYYEFHITANNRHADWFFYKREARGHEYWRRYNFNWRSAVKLSGTLNDWRDRDEYWQVEVAIPWSVFAPCREKPKGGEVWQVAICRYEYSVYLEEGLELSSSSRLSKANFHLKDEYDFLRFLP